MILQVDPHVVGSVTDHADHCSDSASDDEGFQNGLCTHTQHRFLTLLSHCGKHLKMTMMMMTFSFPSKEHALLFMLTNSNGNVIHCIFSCLVGYTMVILQGETNPKFVWFFFSEATTPLSQYTKFCAVKKFSLPTFIQTEKVSL